MNKKEYIAHLKSRGYKVVNENQVSLGKHTYDICENSWRGMTTYYLKLV